MHGGTIRSGRFATRDVVASYWISSIRSFRNTTLPGVTARLRPTSNADSSLIVMRPRGDVADEIAEAFQHARAVRFDRSREHVGIGRGEIRRRHRVDELAHGELEPPLFLGRQLRERRDGREVFGVEQVRLLQPCEIRLLAPRRRRETPVVAGGRRHPRRCRRVRAGRRPKFPDARLESRVQRSQRVEIERRASGTRGGHGSVGLRAGNDTCADISAAPRATGTPPCARSCDRAETKKNAPGRMPCTCRHRGWR